MDPAGYLLYLLAIYVPGFGLLELLGVGTKGESLTEAVGYATGLGFAADTVVLFAGSSGLYIDGVGLIGVTLTKFYVLIGLGLACLALSAILRRRPPYIPRPGLYDAIVLLLALVQGAMVILFLTKYPVFPEYNTADIAGHVNIVKALLNGGVSVPGGLLYYGVHYQLALGVVLTGGIPLLVVQQMGGILAILGTPVVFLAASRIFSSRQAGLVASVIYSLTATIWFGSMFNTGLYPNFFGILASLFFLTLVADFVKDRPTLGVDLAFVAGAALLYLSHYSDVSIIPAVLAVPAIALLARRFQKRTLIPPLIMLAPAGVVFALYPGFVGLLLGFLGNAGGIVVGGTYLSGALSPIPVLANMATETYYDPGFVILVVLGALYVWHSLKERDPIKLLPAVWFFSVIAIAPLNQGAWRMSYIALVPLTLMAAAELASYIPAPQKGVRRRTGGWRKYVVPVLLIILFAGSWGVSMTSDALANTSTSAQSQQSVYSAIMWIGNNTQGGSFLSVSDYRFLYMPQLIGRPAAYDFLSTPAQGLAVARAGGYGYIIVTQLVTAAVPPNPSLFPWNNFPTASNANLTLIYSNSDVRVYRIA